MGSIFMFNRYVVHLWTASKIKVEIQLLYFTIKKIVTTVNKL